MNRKPGQSKLPRYAVHIDAERAKEERSRADKDTVALYTVPSKEVASMKLFRLGSNTNVEFLEAVEDSIFDKTVLRNPMWLHVRIDGNEGYSSWFRIGEYCLDQG